MCKKENSYTAGLVSSGSGEASASALLFIGIFELRLVFAPP